MRLSPGKAGGAAVKAHFVDTYRANAGSRGVRPELAARWSFPTAYFAAKGSLWKTTQAILNDDEGLSCCWMKPSCGLA